MIITHIEVHLLKKPLASSMHISRGGFQVRQHALVKVHTDAGITGIGEGVVGFWVGLLLGLVLVAVLTAHRLKQTSMDGQRIRDLAAI